MTLAYPPGVNDDTISDQYAEHREDCGCEGCVNRAYDEVEATEARYRSAVAELRGRFRAMLAVGQVPPPGMREQFLRQEESIDTRWMEYTGALENYQERKSR